MYSLHYFILILALVISSCGGGGSDNTSTQSENSANLATPSLNISISELSDIDPQDNIISEIAEENGVIVGITAYAEDPDNNINYSLIDSAQGLFDINAVTGVVYLADYNQLKLSNATSHLITVEALSEDTSKASKDFTIAVEAAPNIPMAALVDVNDNKNEIIEFINENGSNVGITVYAEDPDDNVTYTLIDNADGRFIIDETTGVVTVNDFNKINALNDLVHQITVKAMSEDGSERERTFEINILYNSNNTFAIVNEEQVLFDWNSGKGQTFEGWQWLNDVAYENPGWILLPEGSHGGQEQFRWGIGPRSFNKGDYGKDNTALIDVNSRAPSTLVGGSLLVTETESSEDHRSTWWVWYDGKPLSERGVTDKNTDRMSFYLKTHGMVPLVDDGGKESLKINFHIGTYLCWSDGTLGWGQGDGCPYEGIGNQHYYHTMAINSDAWIHVLLDQHPQKRRNVSETLLNNPTLHSDGKNYFEHMSRFYMEIRNPQESKTNFTLDELRYFSTKNMVEPEQNDISITSLWVGYWPVEDHWEIGFHDESYQKYNDFSNSTYEIRWSTTPITNDNFHLATPIEPMFYGGSEAVGVDTAGLIRRANGWGSHAWTRFKLPSEVALHYRKLFFAVKDISIEGQHIGTKWPYKRGDGHDSPNTNVKIIDYYIVQ